MDDVLTIAQATAGRILRMKALYFLLLVTICIAATGLLYGDITAGRAETYFFDLAFLLVSVVGILAALVGCFDLPRERREKTMVALLSKPLGRDRYLVGKFLGISEVALVCMAVVGGGLLVLMSLAQVYRPPLDVIKALIIMFAGVVQLAALSVLLGAFLQEWLATIVAVAVFWIAYALHEVAVVAGGVGRAVISLLPNFSLMSADALVVLNKEISWSLVGGSLLLAVIFSAALLVLAGFIFKRQDIA
jgi:ABC-type transport system involved in multi-copper enzyme maturation permease subunit